VRHCCVLTDNTLHSYSKIWQLLTDLEEIDLEVITTFSIRHKSTQSRQVHGTCHYVSYLTI
jgi:hypothetical protein